MTTVATSYPFSLRVATPTTPLMVADTLRLLPFGMLKVTSSIGLRFLPGVLGLYFYAVGNIASGAFGSITTFGDPSDTSTNSNPDIDTGVNIW